MGCCCSNSPNQKRRRSSQANTFNLLRGRNINYNAFLTTPEINRFYPTTPITPATSTTTVVSKISYDTDVSIVININDILITSILSMISVSAVTVPVKDMEFAECCICIDNVATIRINPCNHACLCENCYVQFITQKKVSCPLCRNRLSKTKPLHYMKL